MPNEQQLSEVLSEFAHTLLTEFPIQGILDHLVKRIVDVFPVTAAGVTLISPGIRPHYVAASDASALRFEQLQTELDEGPCVEAYRTGTAVAMPDLRDDDRFPNFTPRALSAGLAAVFTFPLRRSDSRLGALDLYSDTVGALDADTLAAAQTLADVASAYLLNAQARTDLQDAADRSHDRSLHDALTGLANRTLLLDRLTHAVQRTRRSGRALGVLFVDLDHFKLVNDKYGHEIGDELLVAVARRLTGLLRPSDSLARLSGDEFVILCEDLDEESGLSAIAARISVALAVPHVLSSTEVKITASTGVAFAGPGSRSAAQLIRDADAAMYQAKRKGGGRHQIIDLCEAHLVERRNSLEQELEGATGRGELRVEHQPIVTTTDGRITGVEALLRWAHPNRGIVAPAEVIPLAEESGLITEIGQWVLQQACTDRHRWQSDDQTHDVGISVNVSAQQLLAPDFSAIVAAVLLTTQTDAKLLTLELTESVFLQDGERALVVFDELKKLGVLLALDDFGTGYSSLSYLKRFPVDIVKIDQSFIADVESDNASRSIVSAVIDLAREMGMTTVAEGVENPAQHNEVAALGCDFCQGFYFAQPMSAAKFDTVMQLSDLDGNPRLPVLM
jgi:diguanylate cyclase (GGDEF)-like protein